ncbi:MAG: helix-turn-helix transcriptional regulator [Chloroflexi bacterium]|jgi:DNA-binding HxlR family transcriptional regulator|nr:helix-turn-helix transcriptional regulator [Chloroflexota bacterium]
MDAGLSSTLPGAPRSRAARRAEALRAESPATDALNVLGHKWVLRIIRQLGERTQRFCELQDALGGANSATLSQRLKLLEDEGLVERRAISSMPPWVEYSLTTKGSDLRGAIAAVDRWAERWAVGQ